MGYVLGSFPPGEHDTTRAIHVLRNLMQAHGEAFYAIRRLQPQSEIGYCLHYHILDPANELSPLDRRVAGIQDICFTWAAIRGAGTGRCAFPRNLVLPASPPATGA